MMQEATALTAFSALGQETRLRVFRLLLSAGADGISAGEIAERLGVKQNTMSTNLQILAEAGLIASERRGRQIRYCADLEGVRALLRFLMEDCCGGQPHTCASVLDELMWSELVGGKPERRDHAAPPPA